MNLFCSGSNGLRMPRNMIFKLSKSKEIFMVQLFFEFFDDIFGRAEPGGNTFQTEGMNKQCETGSGVLVF